MSDTQGGTQAFDPKVFLEGKDRVTPVEEITGEPVEKVESQGTTEGEVTPVAAPTETLAEALGKVMRGEEVAPPADPPEPTVEPEPTAPIVEEVPPTSVTGQSEAEPPQRLFPAPSTPTLEQIATQHLGYAPSAEQMAALFELSNRITGLAPDQQSQLEQVLYGTPAPIQQPVQQAPVIQPTIGQPAYGDLDPEVAQVVQQYMAPVQQQLASMQGVMQQQAQQQAAVQQAALAADIESGIQEFASRYSLKPEEVDQLQAQVAQQNILNGLYQAHLPTNPNPGKAAVQTAMEQVYWADPNWRSRDAARQTELVAAQQLQEQADAERKRKASALASGGGTVSRTDTPPTNRQDRQTGLRKELEGILKDS